MKVIRPHHPVSSHVGSGGVVFSKLDLTNAYLQFRLAPSSRHLTTINTPLGLFEYLAMPFGICSASAIFQREMDKLLTGLSSVAVFQDDIVISGSTMEKHNDTLKTVLSSLS